MTDINHNDDNNITLKNDVAEETTSITTTKRRRQQQQQQILNSPPMPQSDSSHVTSPSLPSELITEILARLPVKPLMQFRCVCKSWKTLISDPQFAKKHLALGKATHLILSCNNPSHDLLLRSYSLQSVFKSLPPVRTEHNYKFIIKSYIDDLVASCDGMLCFAVNRSNIFLWNLSIEKVERLPSLINYQYNEWREEIYTIYGFGHDHSSDSYKVVAVFCYRNWGHNSVVYKTEVKVHSLGTSSWRTIQDFPSGVPFQSSGKFVSGTLNWLAPGAVAFSPRVIVSLDLGQESFHELPLPDYGEINVLSLEVGVLKNCLGILAHSRMFSDVWLMKDYGNEESWTKLFRVPYFEDANPFCNAKALCISEDEEVLLQYPRKLVVYNFRSGTFKIPEIQETNGRMFVPMVYVESLISPCSQY